MKNKKLLRNISKIIPKIQESVSKYHTSLIERYNIKVKLKSLYSEIRKIRSEDQKVNLIWSTNLREIYRIICKYGPIYVNGKLFFIRAGSPLFVIEESLTVEDKKYKTEDKINQLLMIEAIK